MKRDDVGPGLREALRVTLRLHDHQMDVETLGRSLADGFQHGKSERNVRHEDTVHHIDMNPLGSAAIHHPGVAVEVTEVGRKHRRGYYTGHKAKNFYKCSKQIAGRNARNR